jgi:hypothetical protein
MATSQGARAGNAAGPAPYRGERRSLLRYVPGFAYVLALYIAGTYLFSDARAPLGEWRGYRFSWAEVLLLVAALVALFEQLRVSQPGIDNTVEAIMMAGMAGAMVLLFALAVAGVGGLAIFSRPEFLALTLIGLAEAVVAILINARSLRRSFDLGDSL